MSDDLISRKELLRKLSSGEFDECSVIYDSDGFPIHISLVGIKNIIRTIPTAFDKEKVIDELVELRQREYSDSDEDLESIDGEEIYDKGRSQGRFEAYHNAIKIVEKGGRE